jgi:hypothetical protein
MGLAATLLAAVPRSTQPGLGQRSSGGGRHGRYVGRARHNHLIGDGNYGDSYARLLKNAGYGSGAPLNMDYFAGALPATQYNKIVYHENHDQAGNESNTERTIVTAVNYAPLIGCTRKYAEARSRFAFGSIHAQLSDRTVAGPGKSE